MAPWVLWLFAAGAFFVLEILTPTFFFFWFGIGAIVASILTFMGVPHAVVWVVFLGLSSVLAFASRKILKPTSRETIKTNAEALVDKEGVVLSRVYPDKLSGKVRIGGEVYTAICRGEPIGAGERVRVIDVNGAKLIVKKSVPERTGGE